MTAFTLQGACAAVKDAKCAAVPMTAAMTAVTTIVATIARDVLKKLPRIAEGKHCRRRQIADKKPLMAVFVLTSVVLNFIMKYK